MAALSAQHVEKLQKRLSSVNHIVLVLSGKGGVGKSSTSVQLALSLLQSQPDAKVGILDVDLTGPSLPRMFGLEQAAIHQSADGWVPVFLEDGRLRCMSIGFLLSSTSESVVWRGPKKTAMVRQFLSDVRWEQLDYLIIDTPPGTSDEHISLLEYLQQSKHPSLSSVLVTTPQAVSLSDVVKELDFTRKTGLRVLGLVENMAGYACPHCGDITPIFGSGGGKDLCDKEGLTFLGSVPIDAEFVKLLDQSHGGQVPLAQEQANGDAAPATTIPATATNGNSTATQTVLQRYLTTTTCSTFKPICQQIIDTVEKDERPS